MSAMKDLRTEIELCDACQTTTGGVCRSHLDMMPPPDPVFEHPEIDRCDNCGRNESDHADYWHDHDSMNCWRAHATERHDPITRVTKVRVGR